MVDSIKTACTNMDIIYEIMLKMGEPRSIPVSYMEINGEVIYVVGGGTYTYLLYRTYHCRRY